MKYDREIVEICLEEVRVKIGGTRRRRKAGPHLVLASLIWPRPMIAEKEAARTVRLENNRADLTDAEWAERILFKEVVQGPFGLKLGVTEPIPDDVLGRFLSGMGSLLFKLAGTEADDLTETSLGGGLVGLPFKYLSRVVGGSGKNTARVIAAGSAALGPAEEWRDGEPRMIEIPLTAPDALYRTIRSRRHGETSTRRRKLIAAGAPNGTVVVSVRVYE